MGKKYSLATVEEVYSFWGKSLLAYRLGVSFFGYASYLRNRAVKTLDPMPGEKILDLACGPGIMFSRVERGIGPEGKLIGVDYVDEMILQCEKLVERKGWGNVRLIKADAAKLDLKENSLDGIIMVIGLSVVPDHKRAIRNCYSFLKKGGRFVVLDGKNSEYKSVLLRWLINLMRWSKSYERKDLIPEIRRVFGNIKIEEHFFGTTFLSISKKR
jgi:ubiquinone/menaquinone biosynthesis C-methylase UbiE